MKLKCILGLFVAVLLLGGGAPLPAVAQAPTGGQLRLLSSDGRGLLLEWTTAGFEVETVERAGERCQRIVIPGTVQTAAPGQPQVPTLGALLGLPAAEGVSLQVVEAGYDVLRGYRLCPAPTMRVMGDDVDAPLVEVLAPDPQRYASDAFYPGRPVEIETSGYLRDQAVAQVQFYPAQYNPVSGEVRLYRRIVARVTWEAPSLKATAEERWASSAYERLLQRTLLNYEALERPGTTEVVTTSPPSSPLYSGGTEGGPALKVVTTNPPSSPLYSGGTEGGPALKVVTTNTPSSPLHAGGTEGGPALKIGVTADGLYRLTYGDLTGAGFGLSGVDPRTLTLRNRGVEIPIYVVGEDDGRFDPGDVLLFYGTAIQDVYTTHNVYWLTAGGSPGLRMSTRDGTPSGGAPVPTHFPVTLHAEEDTYYWVTMPDGEGQDHWFWEDSLTAPASRDYSLTLRNLSTTAPTATVRVRLKGHTDTGTYPDHHTRIYLNGVKVDDQRWDGFQIYDHQVAVSHAYLAEGQNTLRVRGVGDTGAAVDQFFLNWIEIGYWDTYVAEGDELLFGAPAAGTFQFEVTGLSRNQVDVFDVTDPYDVVRITHAAVVTDGTEYKLRFEDAAQPATRYLALTPARRKVPASLELDRPSNWRSPGNGADYILITHSDFYTSALQLAGHRRAQGLRVATVKVEDLYDEFNGGIFNPQALRDFLAYAYNHWTAPAPTYVALLGGASYDYRDLLGLERANYVPTQLIETDGLGQTPSDNWFALLSGTDVLPDMLIGRLAAQSPAEAQDVVDKVIGYETHPPQAPWNTQVLLVADDEAEFESVAEHLAGRLPFYYTARRVYAAGYPPGDPRADVIDHVNGGSLLVHYTGHGNVERWGSWSGGRILNRADVAALDNVGKLPVVSVATCLNGYFAGKNVSMAEEFLLRDERGAAAVWADSGLGYPSGHRVLMGAFYDALFQGDLYPLGAATVAAKVAAYAQSSFWGEMIETYTLFGDPAMPLGIPVNYPYLESTAPADGAGEVPVAQDIEIRFSKPMAPATVVLGGEGTTGLTFTPAWNADHTQVTYAHPNLGYGRTLTFTVSGQDGPGNPLGPGLVPSTWSFATVPAVGMEGATISGPEKGAINTPYAFAAAVWPITATQPVTYLWQATGQAPSTHVGGLNDTVTLTWDAPGFQAITVTATNAGNAVTGTHLLNVLPVVVGIAGPTGGALHTATTFEATVRPVTVTLPITYAWQATGQTPLTHTGGLSDAVTFSWGVTGTQAITVTATHAEGAVSDIHLITIHAPPLAVDVAGPPTGTLGVACAFTATVHPLTATLPLTYAWQATGQPPLTHVSGLSDVVTFTWHTSGTQALTVTAMNAGGAVAGTYAVTIHDAPLNPWTHIYLPVVIKY